MNPGGNMGAILGLVMAIVGMLFGGLNGGNPLSAVATGQPPGVPNAPTSNPSNPAAQNLTGPVAASLFPGAPPASPPAGASATQPPPLTGTPGPTSGDRGSAAENVLGLASAGALASGPRSNDGQLTLTQYGGPTDGTPDSYTASGLGNRGNQLRPTSLALSPDLIARYGLRGGEAIHVRTGRGTFFLGHYDDTTGSRSNRNVIDVYDPGDRLGRDSFLANIPAGQWELVPGPQVA